MMMVTALVPLVKYCVVTSGTHDGDGCSGESFSFDVSGAFRIKLKTDVILVSLFPLAVILFNNISNGIS